MDTIDTVPVNDRDQWIANDLIPHLHSIGKLEISGDITKCQTTIPDTKNNFMASTPYFVNIEYKDNNGFMKQMKLVVKLISMNSPEFLHMEDQFHNETLMYSEIFPSLGVTHMFPKCYYARSTGLNSVVVLEDISSKGFKMADNRLKLSLEHLELAMKEIGRYHGYCYKFKEEHPGKLQEMVEELIDMHGPRENAISFFCEQKDHIKNCFGRGVNYLKNNLPKVRLDVLDHISNCYREVDTVVYAAMKPVEPLAVLCQGDLNRNNLMFRYNDEGKPIEVKILDFQLVTYSSPIVDLSFLIYQNGTYEIRRDSSDYLLTCYFDSLHDVLDMKESVEYSFEEFKKKFCSDFVYGFYVSSFFIPTMFDPKAMMKKMEEFGRNLIDKDSMNSWYLKAGGAECDKEIGDIVRTVYDYHLMSFDKEQNCKAI